MAFLRDAGRRWLPSVMSSAILLGFVLMIVAVGCYALEWRWSHEAVLTEGVVTQVAVGTDAQGDILYLPHVRFSLPNGTTQQFVAPVVTRVGTFKAGQKVVVRYESGKLAGAAVITTWQIYRVSIVLGGLGVVLFDLGMLIRYFWKPERRAALVRILFRNPNAAARLGH